MKGIAKDPPDGAPILEFYREKRLWFEHFRGGIFVFLSF
jgi:hypothetical protein